MSSTTSAYLVIVLVALITVGGDYFLKLAGRTPPLKIGPLIAGCLIYGATGILWAVAMRHLKLTSLSVVFSLSTVLFATALGTLVFRETLSRVEILGVIFALAALALLKKFS